MRWGLTPLLKLIWTPRSLPQLGRNPRFPASTWDEAIFPYRDFRRIPRCPSHSKVGWLTLPNMRGSLSSSSQLERNQEVSATPREKPQDSPLNATWKPIALQPLESNPALPLKTWKEAWLPLCISRGSPRHPLQFERNPLIPAATREKLRVPHLISRWGLIPLPWLKRNPDFPLEPHEEACLTYCKSRGTPRFLPQVGRTPSSSSTRDKSWFPCRDSNGTLSFPSQHERRSDSSRKCLNSLPQRDTPFTPRDKSRVPCLNTRWGLTPLLQLKRKVEFHDSKQDNAWLCC